MSDLKKLMSQLRISKDESQDNNSQKKELSKNLFLKGCVGLWVKPSTR